MALKIVGSSPITHPIKKEHPKGCSFFMEKVDRGTLPFKDSLRYGFFPVLDDSGLPSHFFHTLIITLFKTPPRSIRIGAFPIPQTGHPVPESKIFHVCSSLTLSAYRKNAADKHPKPPLPGTVSAPDSRSLRAHSSLVLSAYRKNAAGRQNDFRTPRAKLSAATRLQ